MTLRSTGSALPDQRVPWRIIALLSLTSFSSAVVMRLLDPMLPRLALEYDAPMSQVAWTVTAASIAYGFLQMVFGPLGDRHGKLRVIAVSGVAAAVASVMCALADSLSTMIIARVLVGASCACMIPLSMAWIGDAVALEQRQPVLARYLIGQILGMATGLGVGGYAADLPQWQWPFWACAALFALNAMWLWHYAARSDQASAPASGRLTQELKGVLMVPWARVVLFTVMCEGIAVMGATTFIATHLHVEGGLSLSTAGAILVAFAGGGLLFALTAQQVTPRLGQKRLVQCGAVFVGLAFTTLAIWPAIGPATVATFVAGMGFYMLHNTLQLNATQMAPERRGAAVALFATCFFVGQAIGTAAGGALVESIGTGPVLLAGAAIIVPLGWSFARRL